MEVEIVNFYLSKFSPGQIKGTLHIYLPEIKMHIRGIICSGSIKNKLFFAFPLKNAVDLDKGKKVKYPIVEFLDDVKIKIMSFIEENAPDYIIQKLKATPKKAINFLDKNKKRPTYKKKPFKFKRKLTFTRHRNYNC